MKGVFVISLTFLLFGSVCAVAICAQRGGQISFGVETDIKKTHRIPRYVIEQIVQNEKNFSAADIAPLSERIKGALVNLNNDNKPDLFVQGDDGANITGFWLFRNANGKWKMVLYSRAAWLQLSKNLTNNFRNVQIQAASAATLWGTTYKFDGVKYVAKSCWEADLSKRKQTKKYFQCSGSSVKPYR